MSRQTQERKSTAGECRQCRAFCDKMIEPRGCVEMGCRYLYSYVDMLTGDQFMGCMQKVFSAEIDLDAVLAPGGFGGVKATGELLPQCQFSVERAFEREGPGYECVNPRFFDCTDQGEDGLRVFDLRDSLS